MDRLLALACFVAVIATSIAVDCTVEQDGIYEVGCKSYAVCSGGKVNIVDCMQGKVYNNATGQCDLETNVGPPCGLVRDCKGKADGQYPDNDQHCRSYYTCFDEKYLGHNFCPSKQYASLCYSKLGTCDSFPQCFRYLVFDSKLNTCNYEDRVPAPCGSMTTS